MIIYFPEMYPDELFYSVFSRYYANSGCITYTQAAEDLFMNPRERLNFQFVNKLRPEVIEHLTKDNSWENVLLQHTLFSYYSRFIKTERRIEAFEILKEMSSGDYMNLLSLTPNRRKQTDYLRYCPLCVSEHRKKYGETYWSRIHQIPENSVCPIHGCKLKNSKVEKDRHKTRYFYPAESVIEDMSVEYGSDKEFMIAKYIYRILKIDIEIKDNIQVDKFLVSKMANTKYLSSGKQIINIRLLHQDLMTYYENFIVGIRKEWQLSKVLHGERINPYEIAQIGLFFNIPVAELIKAVLPDKTPEQLFDEKVVQMIKQGMSMYKIADELKVSTTLIHLIAKNHNIKSSKYEEYATNIKNDFEEKVKCRRKLWIEARKQYPDLSYSRLCEKSEYKLELRWLRRNDKEWTDKHYPKNSKKIMI